MRLVDIDTACIVFRSTVYETVLHLSVPLYPLLQRHAVDLLLSAPWAGDIDWVLLYNVSAAGVAAF